MHTPRTGDRYLVISEALIAGPAEHIRNLRDTQRSAKADFAGPMSQNAVRANLTMSDFRSNWSSDPGAFIRRNLNKPLLCTYGPRRQIVRTGHLLTGSCLPASDYLQRSRFAHRKSCGRPETP